MKRWVFVLVVGIGFLVVTLLFSREDPNLIKCGGKIMSPGDICETTKNGRSTGEDTYAEMKAAAESRAETFRKHGLWMAGVGVVLTGVGATMLIRGKRRKAHAAAAAQPGFPQQQQGFQQPYAGQFPPQPHPQHTQPPQPYPQHTQPQQPQALQPQVQQLQPQNAQPQQAQWQPGPPPQQSHPQQQAGWPQQPPPGGPPQQFGPRGY
ncbi:hypothetical protein [Amycolatopsis speibonae]|uniref:Uncharacterized protein n=1 Tax=Amycolatopsis speibonae TaxID=1450224 RepID=A0ABV7P1C0_9PSEU